MTGGTGLAALDLGRHFGCALDSAGALSCWGYNYNGELGTGTPTTTYPYGLATPQTIPGTFMEVAAGAHHACALDTAGDVLCWGYNDYGEFGDGTFISNPSPTPGMILPP